MVNPLVRMSLCDISIGFYNGFKLYFTQRLYVAIVACNGLFSTVAIDFEGGYLWWNQYYINL